MAEVDFVIQSEFNMLWSDHIKKERKKEKEESIFYTFRRISDQTVGNVGVYSQVMISDSKMCHCISLIF